MTQLVVAVAVGVISIAGSVYGFWRHTLKVLERNVRLTVKSEINGRLDKIDRGISKLDGWNTSHDRKHGHEQRQLIAWMRRHDVSPPDGWHAQTG